VLGKLFLKRIYLKIYYLNRICSFVIVLTIFSCSNEYERKYYNNGNLKTVVKLKDYMWDGEFKEFYQTGELYALSYYSQGKLHGKETLFDKSGNVTQVHFFNKGKKIGRWEFYSSENKLEAYQYFNDEGLEYDYKRFDENGKQDRDIRSKRAIFLFANDTLIKGEDYVANIRLGNRYFNNFEVYLGDLNDDSIFYTKPLDKAPGDNYTALLNISSDTFKIGTNLIQGKILEYDTLKKDTFDVIPFKREIVVLSNS
jgi:antitoxin component YwqK of YwqJK toxin-antitoxin module